VERDDGYIDPNPALPKYYLSEYKDWTSREKNAVRYVKGRVLDIGSGGGRWSLYLQKKDHDVLGVDNSPLAVKVCKLRGSTIYSFQRIKCGRYSREQAGRSTVS